MEQLIDIFKKFIVLLLVFAILHTVLRDDDEREHDKTNDIFDGDEKEDEY